MLQSVIRPVLAIFLYCATTNINVEAQTLEKSRSVWVEQGLVRGKIYKIENQRVQIFRGIPYAEPPVGSLRFKKSQTKSRWEREYSAIEYGSPCIQFMDFHKNDRFAYINMKSESEDCLYLNIFSPYNSEDESQLFPILVWIHGGSFLAGSADTGLDMETIAKNIVFKNVTFISFNYRLGPFGFMAINYGNNKMKGNFGLWDQKLALEWVQHNIKQFNGDPNRVTIMGESAGAAAVSALALSPVTKGLAHQVIAMSGSAVAGWAVHRYGTPQWDMANIAEYMRCNKVISNDDLNEILDHEPLSERNRKREFCNLQDTVPDCLINGGKLNTEELLNCFRKEVNFSSALFRRALSAELGVSKIIVDNEFIFESGKELVVKNARMPLLTGVARREWAHKKPEYYQFNKFGNVSRKNAESSVRKIVESAYLMRLPGKVSDVTIDLIANATFLRYMEDADFYYDMPGVVIRLQDKHLFNPFRYGELEEDTLEADVEFVSPCQIEVDGYANNNLSTFVYSFDYIPKGTLVEEEKRYYSMFGDNLVAITRKDKTTRGKKLDAFHGLDHAFIFTRGYSSNFYIEPYTKRDQAMSRILTRLITNFVIKGNPSTENFTWPAYTNETQHYASITIPPRMLKGSLHYPSPSFWNEEVTMLARYTLAESKLNDKGVSELTVEERIQLNAYRRAWYVLWLFVGVIALVLWIVIICFVYHKSHNSTSKTYDNIVVNR